MTPEQFAYWLQGYFEISNNKKLDNKQIQIIKDHLKLVFDKKTPERNNNINTTKFVEIPYRPFPHTPFIEPGPGVVDYTITCSSDTNEPDFSDFICYSEEK